MCVHYLLFGGPYVERPSRSQFQLGSQLFGSVSTSAQQVVQGVTVSADRLGERGHVVTVVRLLERADDADARAARLAVEANQFPVVCTTCHVFLLHFHVHQTVIFRHLQTSQRHT